MANILIIDDEEFIRESLSERVKRLEHKAWTAATLQEGTKLLEATAFDLVFLDVNLPDGNGLEVLPAIKQNQSNPEVIIITAVGSAQGASLAIQSGAWDYITKPFNREEISLHIKRTLDYRKAKLAKVIPVAIDVEDIIGKSAELKKCIKQVAQCAGSDANVLIFGETGTGKELFARAIHDNCPSVTGEYVVVDCAAMPEPLIESVLFGYIKGAFTGAEKSSNGLIMQADQGTLVLDEVGELPLSMQKTFLRVLQERTFRPVGSSKEMSSNFRLISATNRDLAQMVEDGIFRRDLFHRLNSMTIKLPALRERRDDIPILAQHYTQQLCRKHELKSKALLPETIEFLEAYSWSGNVRELINALEKAILTEPELPVLYPMFLPDPIRINYAEKQLEPSSTPRSNDITDQPPLIESVYSTLFSKDSFPKLKEFRDMALSEIESLYLKSLLNQTQWNFDTAAYLSGISKSRIYSLVKKYNLKKS